MIAKTILLGETELKGRSNFNCEKKNVPKTGGESWEKKSLKKGPE